MVTRRALVLTPHKPANALTTAPINNAKNDHRQPEIIRPQPRQPVRAPLFQLSILLFCLIDFCFGFIQTLINQLRSFIFGVDQILQSGLLLRRHIGIFNQRFFQCVLIHILRDGLTMFFLSLSTSCLIIVSLLSG